MRTSVGSWVGLSFGGHETVVIYISKHQLRKLKCLCTFKTTKYYIFLKFFIRKKYQILLELISATIFKHVSFISLLLKNFSSIIKYQNNITHVLSGAWCDATCLNKPCSQDNTSEASLLFFFGLPSKLLCSKIFFLQRQYYIL